MISLGVTLPVNDPARPDAVRLDRAQVWRGLLRKAENAVPFVPGMQSCTVLERTSDGLVREVVVKGETLREDVVFVPQERVSFTRRDDRASWVIHNVIGQDADGALTLTFATEMTAGPAVEAARNDGGATLRAMRESVRRTVATTLDVIRRTL